MRDSGLKQAILGSGGVAKLAAALSISSQAVSQWDRVPVERVLDVERISGVNRSVIRPDIYPPETKSKPSKPQRAA